MRGRNLYLMGQLGRIDRLAGLPANQQFGQCWWSRQTANMTDQYAVGAHQHGRFLLCWTAEHHAATGCPGANGTRLMQCWDFDEAKENASIEHDADGLGSAGTASCPQME
jgi:hypothetical protein